MLSKNGAQPCKKDRALCKLNILLEPEAQAGADLSPAATAPRSQGGPLGGLGLQISTALEQDLGYIQGEIWGPASTLQSCPFLTIPRVVQNTQHTSDLCLGAFAQLAFP